MKLVVHELHSESLRMYVDDHPELVSSALLRAEAIRAVRHVGCQEVEMARSLFDVVRFVPLVDPILDAAAELDPAALRTLDAIHLAAAQSLGDEVDVIVTYDARMTEGARGLGFRVTSPT